MEENGLKLVKHYEDLNEKQSKFVDKYFEKEVYPVLTPMADKNASLASFCAIP